MRLFSSLTNRIFGAMALLAVVSIGAATYYATAAVTAQAEAELRRGLREAETLVEEYRTLLLEHFRREARLVADLPLLKAAVELEDPPTMAPIAEQFRQQLNAGVLVVTGRRGTLLARVSSPEAGRGILQEVSVPVWIHPETPEVLGTLTVGFWLDAPTAARFRELTNSEIAFGVDGRIETSTLPEAEWPRLVPLLEQDGLTPSLPIGGHDYIAASRPLSHGRVIILRSRTDRLQFLAGVHRTVILVALGAVLAATLATYGIARSVTRPLRAVVAAMREMAATGDLTRRITLPAGTRWQDEDARLLASSLNAMTDSIARFQREAAQRERLSSLGRLSTVVAHEIRNPLMIIKTTLRGLRAPDVSPAQVRAAVADIEEEVARLNRIVSEVLDFARPIKFDLQPVDLNALCRDAARAASGGSEAAGIRLELARSMPALVTDPERLRHALVNVLTNARDAAAAAGRGQAPDAVRLHTRVVDGRATIEIRDRGAGITAEHLPRIFDPFFTTRKTGTGLGLALTRNIVEGLGGSISVTSSPNGTCVRIELPVTGMPV